MVIPVDIDVNQLARLGKDFVWPKPSACPHCGDRLWFHGFTTAYLSCFLEAVFLRRLYCPRCSSVHRLRPKLYWSRFQTSIKTIAQTIAHRQDQGRWRPDIPRSRQRQWWFRLRRKVKVCLGLSFTGQLFDAFTLLVDGDAIPISTVMQCGKRVTS